MVDRFDHINKGLNLVIMHDPVGGSEKCIYGADSILIELGDCHVYSKIYRDPLTLSNPIRVTVLG
jgi:hypothetical protein